jgi:hypothetical protein
MSSTIVAGESTNKLDLVKATACPDGDCEDHVPLQTSDYLLKLAIEKFDKETDNPVEYAMMGLIIASAGVIRTGLPPFGARSSPPT